MTQRFFPRDEYFMKLALREAIRATEHEDVPVGCVIAHEGEVLAAAPVLGSSAPNTTRAMRACTIAPAHIAHGSSVT